ncbi:biotin-dependent carboxyltransferase family protein [Winogradskyella sp.]|jgi:biotin-dependent carboxylase-like uncharacterized protein|uniref:5-oxoprolinase subunit C family protein n=1 Tax=Winogradskyella sp. TaxID=1883156 RepID=UPI0025CE90C3|nr:biotin-dependent carboxyltransferase family protein [Winogradskyella sp.]MCT4629760.1 biotin-dependent carboxyltransferase family protein [Winogradskyella sp.]
MLKVLKSGFYSTVQDTGRFGFRAFGVPVSGAMDLYSSQFANALLGNSKDAAVIEMTMLGATFQFLEPTLIAVSGANMCPKLNGRPIQQNRIITIKANDILSFGRVKKGFRCYLAVKGGITSKKILNSRSMYLPITLNPTISENDLLEYLRLEDGFSEPNALVKYENSFLFNYTVEAYKGREFNNLTNSQQQILCNSQLNISKFNNRMAYQLESLITNSLKPILTSPVLPGTVQLTPKGNLIVLMRDCQTTGGYPRVLQLTEKAINILAQKKEGDKVRIRLKE